MKKPLMIAGILLAGLLTVQAEDAAPKAEGAAVKKMRPAGGERTFGPKFELFDTNGDGAVSKEEFVKHHEEMMARRKEKMGDKFDAERAAKMPDPAAIFAKMDADGNGSLSKEELAARGPQQKRERPGKPGDKPKDQAKPETVL